MNHLVATCFIFVCSFAWAGADVGEATDIAPTANLHLPLKNKDERVSVSYYCNYNYGETSNACNQLNEDLSSDEKSAAKELTDLAKNHPDVSAEKYLSLISNLKNPLAKAVLARLSIERFDDSNVDSVIKMYFENSEAPDPSVLSRSNMALMRSAKKPWSLCNLTSSLNGIVGLASANQSSDSSKMTITDSLTIIDQITKSKEYIQDEVCEGGTTIKSNIQTLTDTLAKSKNSTFKQFAKSISEAIKGTGVISSVSPIMASSTSKPCVKTSDQALINLAQYCQSSSVLGQIYRDTLSASSFYKKHPGTKVKDNEDLLLTKTPGNCDLRSSWELARKSANAIITVNATISVKDQAGNDVRKVIYRNIPIDEYENYLATAAGYAPPANATTGDKYSPKSH